MIRELRRRHRLIITLLAVVTPAIFLAAIAGRAAMPAPGLPPGFLPETPAGLVAIGADWTLPVHPPIRGRYLAPPGDSTPSAIQLSLDKPPTEPDLLVYWSDTPGDSTALPAQAVLLGALHSRGTVLLPFGDAARRLGGSAASGPANETASASAGSRFPTTDSLTVQPSSRPAPGYLILFSLAHQERIATAMLPPVAP